MEVMQVDAFFGAKSLLSVAGESPNYILVGSKTLASETLVKLQVEVACHIITAFGGGFTNGSHLLFWL